MEAEWDEAKARANLHKHGVDFADAVAVMEDELAITIEENHPCDDRFVTLGTDSLVRILVVVYTWRGDRPRLISARKAKRRERQQYQG